MLLVLTNIFFGVILSQGASHRASVLDERDPFRFRHMISTDALQVRNLPSKYLSSIILFPQTHFFTSHEL